MANMVCEMLAPLQLFPRSGPMTFTETLHKHLEAIKARDLDALRETLPVDQLTLIMADGRLVTSVNEFLDLHASWFQHSTWSLATELVHQRETPDLGVAVIRLEYRDHPRDQSPIHEYSYLTLLFARQEGRWVMVHDQNTPIKTRP
jgi:ketosteroid isomerase-like protein